jgi:flagellin-like protein
MICNYQAGIDTHILFKSEKEDGVVKFLANFYGDQKGVSPVIGVILMVAITIIMGAVIAGFTYGYLGTTSKAPNVAFSAIDDSTDSSSLLLKDNGGESLPASSWKGSVTAGKESSANFTTQTSLGDNAVSTGTVLDISTDTNGVAVTTGWYHIVVVHNGSDAILLDTNVLVQ